ncbi:gametocyte-specific factor 1-like isoform X3 [Dinothrombium tinctorium]|uniref:Gametocyte-specific factor 1-like isoform X3 n=1 Tax=Dinothrombium tinctorium TaxID=1965070 RepID=A0A443R085_9ACAR|nr:gametocyte-specific factor 1-like isoform X3 [Dinothrombium tinctorium]
MADFVDPCQSDEYVTCPYNPAHRLRRNRMPYHLVKCAQNNPQKLHSFMTCPYNASHRVPKQQFDDHLATCATGKLVFRDDDLEKVAEAAKRTVEPVIALNDDPSLPNDWDDDVAPFAAPVSASESSSNEINNSVIQFGRPTFRVQSGARINEANDNTSEKEDKKPITFGLGRARIIRSPSSSSTSSLVSYPETCSKKMGRGRGIVYWPR